MFYFQDLKRDLKTHKYSVIQKRFAYNSKILNIVYYNIIYRWFIKYYHILILYKNIFQIKLNSFRKKF